MKETSSSVGSKGLRNQKEDIQIKVENYENQSCYIWTTSKFQNKLMMMRELVNAFQEGQDLSNLSSNDDPFIDFA